MKVKVSDLINIIGSWVDQKILPKANTFQKVAVTFALMQAKPQIEKLGAFLMPDAEGKIDLDQTMENAKAALKKGGGSLTIPVINYVIDEQDLNDLHQIAKGYAQ